MGSSIEYEFREFVAKNLRIDLGTVTDETTIGSLDIDSLDVLDLALALREEYDLVDEVPNRFLRRKTTIGQLWNYIDLHREKNSSSY